MLHTVPRAGGLERIGREAGAALGEHMCDLERKGPEGVREEGHRRGGGLVVLDGEMHVAGGAVDGGVQVALARDAVAVLQLGQVLHVDVDEADLVVLEAAVRFAGLLGWRQPVVRAWGGWRASVGPPGRMAAHTVELPRIGFDRPTRCIPATFRNQTTSLRGRLTHHSESYTSVDTRIAISSATIGVAAVIPNSLRWMVVVATNISLLKSPGAWLTETLRTTGRTMPCR